LQIGGHEILYLDTTSGYWGSTFWPSPQQKWTWPPPKAIDIYAYAVISDGDKILLESGFDKITRLNVKKTLMISEIDTAIIIRYTMINNDTIVQKYAPWEITRVPCAGMVMAAKNHYENEYMWFDLNKPFFEKSKITSDSEGWLVYVTNDNYVFIKSYTDILPAETAPGEGEFELYRDKNIYVELENQGKFQDIAPKDSMVWDVKWFVRKLPSHISPYSGNNKLIEYVLNFVEKDNMKLIK
jgi:hypothetical protein